MAIVIKMPKLSDTMQEGTILRWLKNAGDSVSTGDVIAEIQTDKAVMEMTAFDDGLLHEIYVKEGQAAPLGKPLALMLEEGEAPPVPGSTPVDPPASDGPPARPAASVKMDRPAPRLADGASVRIKVSPLARKIARKHGVNLATITGSGPAGRILHRDVEAALLEAAPVNRTAPSASVIRPVVGPADQRTPLSPIRKIIAERLLASKTQIPHFYLNLEIDAGKLTALRQQINESSKNKLTVNDFILKAAAEAAVLTPAINASFDGDSIVRFASVNISVAIAIQDGLVTPVIRDAGKMSLPDISRTVKDFAERARNLRLTPEEFQGGTLTVSNLGGAGIDHFAAIINPPQAAIVSVGAIKKKPVVNDLGEIVVGERLWLGLSCDHRVIDGSEAASYLGTLKKLLENPTALIL